MVDVTAALSLLALLLGGYPWWPVMKGPDPRKVYMNKLMGCGKDLFWTSLEA
jgi:hypothetical protein